MRSVFGVFILLIGIVTLFLDKSIFDLAINNNFSWTLSKLLPWIIVLISAVFSALLIKKNLSSPKWRISVLIGTPVVLLSLMFAFNPIYTGDYLKRGTALSIQDNELLEIIEDHKESFNGLVAVVDYNCPFCKMATKERLKSF